MPDEGEDPGTSNPDSTRPDSDGDDADVPPPSGVANSSSHEAQGQSPDQATNGSNRGIFEGPSRGPEQNIPALGICPGAETHFTDDSTHPACHTFLPEQKPFAFAAVWVCAAPAQHKWRTVMKHAAPSFRSTLFFTPVSFVSAVTKHVCSPLRRSPTPRQHKILRDSAGRSGPVARARAYARAAGLPWPYARGLEEHAAGGITVAVQDEAETARASLAVCVLLPCCQAEKVEVSLPVPATVAEAVETRSGFDSQAFPHVLLPTVQCSQRWLLAIAVPSWAVTDTHVVFDLTDIDARLYVTAVPAFVDSGFVLRIAQVGDITGIEVFVDTAPNPMPPRGEIRTAMGMTFAVRHAGRGRRFVHELRQVLQQDAFR